MNKYNIWNPWDPLKTILLGNCYSADFFRPIKNKNIRSALQRIADETQEDLDQFENSLKQFGCRVIRPQLDSNETILDHTDSDGSLSNIPRPPMNPRDHQIVLGNEILYTGFDHQSLNDVLNEYNQTDVMELNNPWIGHQNFGGIEAPCFTLIGKDLYIDHQIEDHHRYDNDQEVIAQCIKNLKSKVGDNFRFHRLDIGGHNDGIFCLVKPGVIINGFENSQDYDKTFPQWDVLEIRGQGWPSMMPFLHQRHHMGFWVPGEESNNDFDNYVNDHLNKWVGYSEESVFDLNCLSLDEHHLCVSQNNNYELNNFLKKHNVEPVYVQWRHKWFWDGGLHCITLDLEREGKQQDYFPERKLTNHNVMILNN